MEKYFDVLHSCPLFDQIADFDMQKMLQCFHAKIETYEKRQTILAEGVPANQIGIVLSGSVQLIQIDYFGNRNILNSFVPSQIFAEDFACAQIASLPISIVANEPCTVMLIESTCILHTCNNYCGYHQQLIFNLMKELAEKTVLCYQKIEITSKRSTRDKLLTYLLLQSKQANSTSFTIPFNRQELADYLEVERSGLSMEISKLREEGILKSTRSHFELLCLDF